MVQIGSKAFSNVAGQFTKLSQSLTPRVKTGKKSSAKGGTPHSAYNPSSIVIEQGVEHEREAQPDKDGDSTDSEENDCSIYEPDDSDLVEENPIYTENTFIPGVGIVMAQTELNPSEQKAKQHDVRKMSADVPLTTTLGEPSASVRSLSPAPEIHIQDTDEVRKNLSQSGGQKLCHSAVEISFDATSPGESS